MCPQNVGVRIVLSDDQKFRSGALWSKFYGLSRFKTNGFQTPEFKFKKINMLFPENFVQFKNENSTHVEDKL